MGSGHRLNECGWIFAGGAELAPALARARFPSRTSPPGRSPRACPSSSPFRVGGTAFFILVIGFQKQGEITIAQSPVFAWSKIVEIQLADGDAFEVGHFETLPREHAANLSFHSLMDHDVQRGGAILASS